MRFLWAVLLVAALPPLGACTSTSSPGSSQQAGGSTSPPAGNPNARLLTGLQLKTRLAPASWFPSGFTADPTGSANSGNSYEQLSPPPGGCTRMLATGWVDLAGVGAVSFAQNDYIDRNTSQEYAQMIDVYRAAGASRVMTGLRKLADRCQRFRDQQTGSTVTVSLKKGPQLGDDALTFTLSSPRWLGDTILEAVRVGTAVITVLHTASSTTGKAETTKLAAAITANLHKNR